MWLGWAFWEEGGAISEDLTGVSQLPHKVSAVGFALCNMPSRGVRDEEAGRRGEQERDKWRVSKRALELKFS